MIRGVWGWMRSNCAENNRIVGQGLRSACERFRWRAHGNPSEAGEGEGEIVDAAFVFVVSFEIAGKERFGFWVLGLGMQARDVCIGGQVEMSLEDVAMQRREFVLGDM